MKKTLLSFICLLTLNHCLGQNVNRTAHRGGSTVTGQMVGINSKSFYIETTTLHTSCCNDKSFVVGIGDAGEELFRKVVCSVPYLENPRIAISADKEIFTCAGTKYKGCDYGGALSTVSKLDTLGNILWSFNLNEEIDQLVALADGGVGIIIADDFRRYSKSGALLSSTLLKSGAVKGICALGSGNLLLSYQGSAGPRLRVITLNDSVISDIAFASFLPLIKEGNDGNIYGINNGFLMKVSLTSGLLLHSNAKLPSNTYVKSLQMRNDSLFALVSNSVSSINFTILDTGFHILHQKATNISSAYGTGFYIGKNNKLNVATIAGNGYTYSGFLQTNITGNLNAAADIGVTGITVIDSTHAAAGTMYRMTNVSANVTVRNFGADTIKQFCLNHYSTVTGISFCLIGLHKQFTVTIPPSGTVSVNTGSFSTQPPHAYFTDSYTYSLCIYATIPDNRHDVNTRNDGLCRTITMVPVGLKDVESDNFFSIYPNPVNGKLNITSAEEIKTAGVFDLSGRLVQQIQIYAGAVQDVKIDLPDGVYILRVSTKSGVRNHKFCVVNN